MRSPPPRRERFLLRKLAHRRLPRRFWRLNRLALLRKLHRRKVTASPGTFEGFLVARCVSESFLRDLEDTVSLSPLRGESMELYLDQFGSLLSGLDSVGDVVVKLNPSSGVSLRKGARGLQVKNPLQRRGRLLLRMMTPHKLIQKLIRRFHLRGHLVRPRRFLQLKKVIV